MTALEEDYEKEKKDHKKDVEEMDRERIKATEKLKKDMLYKIKETREHVLALNDEQLHTTTRFTILENHRLTTELEYQKKQTDELGEFPEMKNLGFERKQHIQEYEKNE